MGHRKQVTLPVMLVREPARKEVTAAEGDELTATAGNVQMHRQDDKAASPGAKAAPPGAKAAPRGATAASPQAKAQRFKELSPTGAFGDMS